MVKANPIPRVETGNDETNCEANATDTPANKTTSQTKSSFLIRSFLSVDATKKTKPGA